MDKATYNANKKWIDEITDNHKSAIFGSLKFYNTDKFHISESDAEIWLSLLLNEIDKKTVGRDKNLKRIVFRHYGKAFSSENRNLHYHILWLLDDGIYDVAPSIVLTAYDNALTKMKEKENTLKVKRGYGRAILDVKTSIAEVAIDVKASAHYGAGTRSAITEGQVLEELLMAKYSHF